MEKGIILLSAVKESGKTTTFNFIKKNAHILGLKEDEVIEMMLARKLKDTVSQVFNLPIELMDDVSVVIPGETVPEKYKEFLSNDIVSVKTPVREIPFKDTTLLISEKIREIVSSFGFKENVSHTLRHSGKVFLHTREAMQYVGTELLREYDDEVHCNAALRVMRENPNGKLFVVTDARFHNELDFFKEKSFTAGIIRDEKINASKERIAQGKEHKSEIYAPELIERCKFKIDNNGDLANLDRNVASFLREIRDQFLK